MIFRRDANAFLGDQSSGRFGNNITAARKNEGPRKFLLRGINELFTNNPCEVDGHFLVNVRSLTHVKTSVAKQPSQVERGVPDAFISIFPIERVGTPRSTCFRLNPLVNN
jgi:hypothetical protein